MYRKFFFDKGGYLQLQTGSGSPGIVPFPVCLAIRFGDDIREECPDFILNIEQSWVFVRTTSPLPRGTTLLMHFYIPPEDKLLAEVKGRVLTVNRESAIYPKGMLIKFGVFSLQETALLEKYLEGNRPLLDKMA
ncbi:MAG: hypothetical protein M0024_05630 [Nitrospiraceae bacterium]|nr:hypothetical protein [Nitrospiraceae bacterium]